MGLMQLLAGVHSHSVVAQLPQGLHFHFPPPPLPPPPPHCPHAHSHSPHHPLLSWHYQVSDQMVVSTAGSDEPGIPDKLPGFSVQLQSPFGLVQCAGHVHEHCEHQATQYGE